MAIQTHQTKGKTYYTVYLNGVSATGERIQRKRRRDRDGNRITSLRKAEQVEFELKKELEIARDDLSSISFEEWRDECLARMRLELKAGTVLGYEGDLKRYVPRDWDRRTLNSFEKREVFDLVFNRIEASPNRRKDVLKKLKRIFEMAVEEGILPRNPALGIRVKVPPPEQRVLTPSEVEKLLIEARDSHHRFYSHWALALFSGMRSGELYALRISDIDLEGGLIHVTKQWTSKDGVHETKGNRNRVVPIAEELKPLLASLKSTGGHREKLFQWSRDRREKVPLVVTDLLLPRRREWRTGQQAEVLRDFCQAIGITEVKFHDLRATFITNLLAQGVSLAKVMSIVGHTKTATTDVYLRLAGVNTRGSTNELGYRLGTGGGARVLSLLN